MRAIPAKRQEKIFFCEANERESTNAKRETQQVEVKKDIIGAPSVSGFGKIFSLSLNTSEKRSRVECWRRSTRNNIFVVELIENIFPRWSLINLKAKIIDVNFQRLR